MGLPYGYLQTADEYGGKRRIVMRAIADATALDNAAVEQTLQAMDRVMHMLKDKMTEQDVDAQEIKSGIERLMNCEKSMERSFGMKTENKAHSL